MSVYVRKCRNVSPYAKSKYYRQEHWFKTRDNRKTFCTAECQGAYESRKRRQSPTIQEIEYRNKDEQAIAWRKMRS